jgi:hypothetical protein
MYNSLNYSCSVFDSSIACSHDVQTRSGDNQSRSGTGRLFGEHTSQTPSPHFRLKHQRKQ